MIIRKPHLEYRYLLPRLLIIMLLLLFCQWLMAYLAFPLYARIDLFLYLIVVVAPVLKPLHHLLFAVSTGYILDTLSGRLWGFHIATYICAVAFMHLAADEIEMRSLPYQVVLTALCVIIQEIFILVYAVNSYTFFSSLTDFVVSILIPRFGITILGAILFLIPMSAWLGGGSEP
jgi:hypothetical protein